MSHIPYVTFFFKSRCNFFLYLCMGSIQLVYLKDTDEDEFWQELKNSVALFLKQHGEKAHYSLLEGVLFLVYYITIHALLSYLTWIQGSLLASVLLGINTICMLANTAHMSTHSGFTKSPLLDFIAMHLFDLTGTSGLQWQITHQTHHNQPHSSIDHQTCDYTLIGVRIHKYMKRKVFHRFQHIYCWFTQSIYFIGMFLMTTLWIFRYKHHVRHTYDMMAHLLLKGILLFQVTYCFYLHGLWIGLAILTVYSIVYSQCAFLLLFNDHEENMKMLGEVENVNHFHGKLSWAEVQVRTSGNWYPTNWPLAFVEFHYGYFNYHIEHHLFPTFKPSLLKKISPVVRKVCNKYGIPYISTSFVKLQQSQQCHLAKLSI